MLKKINHIIEIILNNFFLSALILFFFIFAVQFIMFRFDYLNFNIPFAYGGGDGLLIPWFIKNILNDGDMNFSNLSSAPVDNFKLHQWPIIAENIHLIFFRIISFFNKDIHFILNFYFLLKFYIIALLCFFCLKLIGISSAINIVLSILFAFSPIVFTRYYGHYFLGIYYAVPSFFGIVIYCTKIFLQNYKIKKKDYLSISVFIFFTSLSGIYYAYFSIIFLIILFFSFLIIQMSFYRFNFNIKIFYPLIAVILITLIIFIFSIDFYKIVLKISSVRNNPAFVADFYGLKFSSLIAPISNHVFKSFAEFRNLINSFPLTNENALNSVGIISSFGLICLTFWPFINIYFIYKKKTLLNLNSIDIKYLLLNVIHLFFLVGFFIATIGGLSIFIIQFIFPMIRVYSRISIFYGFFGLLFVGIILEYLKSKILVKKKNFHIHDLIFKIFLFFLLTFGLVDQIGKFNLPAGPNDKHFESDKKFFSEVERNLPKYSKIFILPVFKFPEHPPINEMIDYDHLRAHVHTKNIHFTYPSFNNDNSFKWQVNVSKTPLITDPIKYTNVEKLANYSELINIKDFITECEIFNFKGIIIDQKAFKKDDLKRLIDNFKNNLKEAATLSDDNRYIFFKLNESPLIIEVDVENYPTYLKIIDKEKIKNSKLPEFLNKEKIYNKIDSQSTGDKINIYYDTKEYFDNLYKF
jgi:hypothetical protein